MFYVGVQCIFVWLFSVVILLLICPQAYSVTRKQSNIQAGDIINSKGKKEKSFANKSDDQPTDSAINASSTMLQEYVVTAENAFYNKGVLTVIPSRKQKKYSSDGNELLSYLHIPQLIYDPSNKTISHISGNLAIYINGRPASDSEVKNLKTTDVKRVEYLDFPQDLRYDNNPHVVNFIVEEYEVGGYSRAKIDLGIPHFANFLTELFSKFSVNNWIFDLSASCLASDYVMKKDQTTTTYFLKDDDGDNSTLTETSSLLSSKSKRYIIPVSFRFQYVGSNYYISNTFGLKNSISPTSSTTKESVYSGIYNDLTHSETSMHSKSNSFLWSGYYKFMLPRRWSLMIAPYASYTRGDNVQETDMGLEDFSPVVFKSDEKNYALGYSFIVAKLLGKNHSIMGSLEEYHRWYDIDYMGTTHANSKMRNSDFLVSLGYKFHLRNFYMGAEAGYACSLSKTNGIPRHDNYPYVEVNFNYNISRSQMFSLYGKFKTQSASVSRTTSDVIQLNNFMYATGDPKIRNPRELNLNANWSWLASNYLQILFYADYRGVFNQISDIYTPWNNGKALLRTSENDGNFHKLYISSSISVKDIASCLSVSVVPSVVVYSCSGTYARNMVVFDWRAYLTLLLDKGFSLNATAIGPKKNYNSGKLHKSSLFYSIGGKWSHNNLHIGISLYNFFNYKSKAMMWDSFESEFYKTSSSRASFEDNAFLSVSVSYLISYGKKKVDIGDEVRELKGIESGTISY